MTTNLHENKHSPAVKNTVKKDLSIPASHRRVMIFDTETTGLIPRHKSGTPFPPIESYPYIMQISWIIYNVSTNQIEELVDEYVRIPETAPISPESIQVHGITREIANEKGKPILPLLEKFFVAYMKCDCIVAHNLQFDSELVRKEMWRNQTALEAMLGSKDRVHMMCSIFTKKFNTTYNIDTFCTMMNTIQFCGIEFVAKSKIAELLREFARQELLDTRFAGVGANESSLDDLNIEEGEMQVSSKRNEVDNPLSEAAYKGSCRENLAKTSPPINNRKKFPKLNELYGKLFETPLPMDMHNSIVDVLVCLRCFLKIRGAKELSEEEFLGLILTHSRG